MRLLDVVEMAVDDHPQQFVYLSLTSKMESDMLRKCGLEMYLAVSRGLPGMGQMSSSIRNAIRRVLRGGS